MRKLKRYLSKQIDLTAGQKSFQYITIAEPQGENHGNSWHLHILLIFDDTAPFIENDTIAELWSPDITSIMIRAVVTRRSTRTMVQENPAETAPVRRSAPLSMMMRGSSFPLQRGLAGSYQRPTAMSMT